MTKAMRRMDPPYLPDPAVSPATAEYRKIMIPLAVWLWTRLPDTVRPKNVMSKAVSISSRPVSRSIPPLKGSS